MSGLSVVCSAERPVAVPRVVAVPLVLYPADGWLWLGDPATGELLGQGRHVELHETPADLVAAAAARAATRRPRPLVQAASPQHATWLCDAFAAAAAGDDLRGERWSAERQRELFGAYWRLRAAV